MGRKKTLSKLESGDMKRSVRSCVDSVDHHNPIKKKKRKKENQLITIWVCMAQDCA